MQMDGFESQKICAMGPDVLDFWWSDVERLLDETPHLWRHMATKQDIHNSLMKGVLVAWSTVTKLHELHFLAFTLEIERPSGNCLRVVYQAGEGLEAWQPLLVATLENFARRNNLATLEFMGPPEQNKSLLEQGYSVSEMIVTRPLGKLAYH